jgi:hypothetical protein
VETTDPQALAAYAEYLRPVVATLRTLAEDATAARPMYSREYLREEMLKAIRVLDAYSGRLGHPFRQHPGTRSGGIPPGSERSDGALDRDRSAATGSWIDGDSPLGEGTLG